MNSLVGDRLRILYVGPLGPRSTGLHRFLAMQRLGHDVSGLDTLPYIEQGGKLPSYIRMRTLAGAAVEQLNRRIPEEVRKHRPQIIWFDKALFVRRPTVAAIRAQGVYCIHQNDDDPFERNGTGWGNVLETLPEYDLQLTPRRVSIPDLRNAGARDVFWFIPAYEPTMHFPPPESWSEKDRTIDVAFIGTPFGKRPHFLRDLRLRYGIGVKIWGDPRWVRGWPRAVLPPESRLELYQGSSLSYDEYRQIIWRTRISLGFVNELNRDEFSGRSFEIPAGGGFFLAEDTPGHRELYRDGEEVVLFRSVEDCAEKILRYLPDIEARERIAKAGTARAHPAYSVDARVQAVLDYVRTRS